MTAYRKPGNLMFLAQFLRAPMTIGAVAPSSRELARRITADIPSSGEPNVLELGPGTGVFSVEIQRRLAGRGKHVAIEINPTLGAALRDAFPALDVVEANAADAVGVLRDRGIQAVDLIISGLPWAVFPAATQERILSALTEVVRPEGRLLTFAYSHAMALPPAVAFRRRLASRFDRVLVSETVWRNFPPARIITASGPSVTGRTHT